MKFYNPNPFDFYLDETIVDVETENGEVVGNIIIDGIVLKSMENVQSVGHGNLTIESLNAKKLKINLNLKVGAKIAGYNKTLDFITKVTINPPDIYQILSERPTDVILLSNSKLTLNGLIDETILEFHNPNKFSLVATDVTVTYFDVVGEKKIEIAKYNMEGGEIKAEDVTIMTGTTTIPYSKLLPINEGKIIPDGLLVVVRSNITIQGLDHKFYVGVSGYQDFNLLK